MKESLIIYGILFCLVFWAVSACVIAHNAPPPKKPPPIDTQAPVWIHYTMDAGNN